MLCFFQTTQLHSFLNISPWLVLENKTPIPFICDIEIVCGGDSEVTLHHDKNNPPIMVKFTEFAIESISSVIVSIQFALPANDIIKLNHIFFVEKKAFCPQINNVSIESPSLQMTHFFDIENENHCHFSVDFKAEKGMILQSQPISIATKILNTTQQSLQSLVGAVLQQIEKVKK